ncbi:MAG: hypothetical protein RSB41_03070 [Bacilli bacterium]
MSNINELFTELGISKVKLAKYLGVSRQMVYNYLDLDDINKWPKEKKILIFKLLDITDGDSVSIKGIKVTSEYLERIDSILSNNNSVNTKEFTGRFNFDNLSKNEEILLNDLIFLIKEKFSDEKKDDTYDSFLYLYHVLQSIENVPEIKYIFAYLAKSTGFCDPNEYKFDESKQFILESIIFTAMNLYSNGGATKSKLVASHERFVEEIQNNKEEMLSRTQELNTIRLQAMRELGYNVINTSNAQEVFDKIAEIQSRKV